MEGISESYCITLDGRTCKHENNAIYQQISSFFNAGLDAMSHHSSQRNFHIAMKSRRDFPHLATMTRSMPMKKSCHDNVRQQSSMTSYYWAPAYTNSTNDCSKHLTQVATRFTYPRGMKGCVDLGGLVHTNIVYLSADHPSTSSN